MAVIRRLAWPVGGSRALIVALISVSLIGGAALALHSSQSAARRGADARFASRATLAANFIGTYVYRTHRPARSWLPPALSADNDPTAAFNANIAAFGFEDGVLLDSSGRALAVWPATPGCHRHRSTDRSSSPLQRALLGYVVVSDVEASAVKSAAARRIRHPVQHGIGAAGLQRRYLISSTPLAAFLDDSTTLEGRTALPDRQHRRCLCGEQHPDAGHAQTLTQLNPALGIAAAKSARRAPTVGLDVVHLRQDERFLAPRGRM